MNNQILYAIKNLEQRVVDLYSKIKNINISSAGDLQAVTTQGNETTNNVEFNDGAKIIFDNGSRLQKGTTNSYNGGNGGIAQICSIDYELKWEAGRLYVLQQDGFTIREVSHNFTLTPGVNDDITRGFVPGSRWILDNGDIYLCSQNTEGAAVWVLIYTLPKYKVYTALLTQSGEVAPTAVILENTLGGEVTFEYVGYGRFYIRKNYTFLSNKVMVLVNSIDKNNNKITTNKDLGINVIEIQTSSNDVLTNDILNSTSIEIRVYN